MDDCGRNRRSAQRPAQNRLNERVCQFAEYFIRHICLNHSAKGQQLVLLNTCG